MNCRKYCLKMTLTRSARRLQTYISAILQVSSKLFLPFLQLPLSISVKTKQPTITDSEQVCLGCALRQPSQPVLDTISWAPIIPLITITDIEQVCLGCALHQPSQPVLDTISWAPISTGHHQLGILQYWTPSAGHPSAGHPSVLDTLQHWTPSAGHPSAGHPSVPDTISWASFSWTSFSWTSFSWTSFSTGHHQLGILQYWTPSAGHPSSRSCISMSYLSLVFCALDSSVMFWSCFCFS